MAEELGRSIGTVVAVDGASVLCAAEARPGEEAAARLGMLVRIATPKSVAYAVVNRVETREGRFETQADLIGEVVLDRDQPAFERGVSLYPTLGAEGRIALGEDYAVVYARPAGHAVRFGALYQDRRRPAYLLTDDLMAKHFAVLGTTGSGKSCAVALILRRILEAHPYGHVILLDPHAEYGAAFGDMAEVIDLEHLHLPYWLLNFEEACEVLIRGGTEYEQESQAAILKDAIIEAKRLHGASSAYKDALTVDTPVPYRLSDLVRIIDNAAGKLDKPDTAVPYMRLKARLESLAADKRYAFMFSTTLVRDILPQLLARLLRIPNEGKPLTVLDLSGIPSEITNAVVSLLCRTVFDFALWSDRGSVPPVLLVAEEAHRYVPQEDATGFAATKRALARIAKEGRKYGVSLCLVSQRPSELDVSVLSQCSTLFALRMGNDADQNFVHRALPENARGMMQVLPALRRQESVVVGEGVSVPMRILFDDLPPEHRPRSGSVAFSQAWREDPQGLDVINETIRRWRSQQRDSEPPEPPPEKPGATRRDPDTPLFGGGRLSRLLRGEQ